MTQPVAEREDAEQAGGHAPVEVAGEDVGLRLDRWFKRHYPGVSHGQLEKLLRTGQVRIDGRRAKAGDRLAAGQHVRVPPAAQRAVIEGEGSPARPLSENEAQDLRKRVLFRDEAVVVIDKPAGLAVQGGTKTPQHLDAMLDALRFDGERPRLVHRLDKDTSGVLVLARTARAAAALTSAFRIGAVGKLYWAVVVGAPKAAAGRITQSLAKRFGVIGERVAADEEGRSATTDYRVVERAGGAATWLALQPRTGRTHQLRVHCAFAGTPILGDGKYGGGAAFIKAAGISNRLHLHARALRFPHPNGGEITIVAPLPPHMRATWKFFGFSDSAPDHALPDLIHVIGARKNGRQVARRGHPRPRTEG
jgi:23S rRNA pseudouridine955/2504/2580 synthase